MSEKARNPELVTDASQTSDSWERYRDEFRDACHSGTVASIPSIREWLRSFRPDERSDLLLDLVSEHLLWGWEAGSKPMLEDYVREFGSDFESFASLQSLPADLVENEFAARHAFPATSDRPTLEDYDHRFGGRPDLIDHLRSRCMDGERYILTRFVGEGGLGSVWEAYDRNMERYVAIKTPHWERRDSPLTRDRFEREARVTSGLDHPSIVTIHEHRGRDLDEPFYVMRLVQGQRFADLIREYHTRTSAFGPNDDTLLRNELLRHFTAVCQAIAYAHQRGVIHRDLKPHNVVVGAFGEAVVLDWGLAEIVSRGGSCSPPAEEPVGTFAYMPPEQARGESDFRSDIFGLGSILYSILTGRAPYLPQEGEDETAFMARILEARYPHPRKLNSKVPRDLEAVCLKSMSLDPQDRYGSASELGNEMARILADEPISARREAFTERTRRWMRRRRTLVAAVTVAALVAMVGSGVVLAVQARANRELRAANTEIEAQFDLELEAVRALHTGVSENLLLKEKKFEALRTKMLGEARSFYARLEKSLKGRTDRRSQAALAAAYFELGDLTAKIGTRNEALVVHERGLAVREALARGPGSNDQTRADLAESLMAVGRLLIETGKRGEGVIQFKRAVSILEPLVLDNPKSTKFGRDLATCHNDIASVLSDDGQFDQAQASFEKALEIQERLNRISPRDPRIMNDQARSHLNIALVLYRRAQPTKAKDASSRALAIYQALREIRPDDLQCQREIAMHHYIVGVLLFDEYPLDALASFQKALESQKKLAEAIPGSNEFQSDLARSHGSIGLLRIRVEEPQQALASFEEAARILEPIVKADPKVIEYVSELAKAYTRLGAFWSQAKKSERALSFFERALTIHKKLVQENPEVVELKRYLALSYNNIGCAQFDSGDTSNAQASLESALEIREELAHRFVNIPEIQAEAADAAIELGIRKLWSTDPAAHLRLFRKANDRLEGIPDPSGEKLYAMAQVRAQIGFLVDKIPTERIESSAEHFAAAMNLLRQAVAKGFRDLSTLQADPALDPLRSRSDFKLLMRNLEIPSSPSVNIN